MNERPSLVPYYYVVRTYNGPTARKTLWKVLYRRMKDKRSAEDWMDFEKKTEKTKCKQEFFVITKMEEPDKEYGQWYDETLKWP